MPDSEMANIQHCIEACAAALRACQACAAADIREGMNGCAPINLDCADICAATLNVLSRGSPHHGDYCALCAHICRACAAECAKHAAMHQHCIEACAAAMRACQACAAADIREGMNGCAPINLDCADICAATLNVLSRGSPHHGDFCALCAHICRACAAECAKHAAMHQHCAECQAACERCAAECDKHARERHI